MESVIETVLCEIQVRQSHIEHSFDVIDYSLCIATNEGLWIVASIKTEVRARSDLGRP